MVDGDPMEDKEYLNSSFSTLPNTGDGGKLMLLLFLLLVLLLIAIVGHQYYCYGIFVE